MDLIRLVLYHSRIANAHIHDFRIANSEERELQIRKNGVSNNMLYSNDYF